MKVRVGLGLAPSAAAGAGAGTFWTIVDACEALGWDSIWFSERLTADAPDPLAAMAAVAGRTRRLKFGPSVLVIPGRNPVLLAKQLATIDVLSGGRLVAAFGLGADGSGLGRALGVDRAEAGARTDEAVALMKRLWTEDDVTFEGRFFRTEGLSLRPRPAQRPHPDVWFGGVSPPALRRAGRLGDGWLPSFVAPGEYGAKAAAIREAAAAAGRAIDPEHFGALVPYVPEGAGDLEPILAAVAARRPGADPRDLIVTGGRRALRERLEAFVERDASKFVVTPVVAPRDWAGELHTLRAEVAEPLER